MKKILLVLEYVRQGYVSKDNNVDFWSSEEGKNYFKYFKESGINKRNIEVAYFYPQIPEPKKVSNRGQVFSYKTPPKKEWEPLLHKLEEKIDAVQPDIIIPTGALGNSYFTGKSAVKDVRGKPTEFERNKINYAVIPLYGPTAILINANLANSMRSDVSLIGSFLVEGEKALEPKIGEYEAVTTIERVREIFNYIKTDKPVTAWDLETNTLEPNLKGAKALVASLSWEEGQGVTIYLEHKETPFTKEEIAETLSYLKEVLADETIIKVTHNGKYDMHFLMAVYNFKTFKNVRDTMVGYWLTVTQEKEDSFRLTDLTFYYTDMGGYDDALEDYKKKYISEFKEKEKERVTQEKEEQKELKRAYAKEHGVTQKVATERLNLETPVIRKLVNEVDGSNFNYEWIPLDILYPYASGDTDATLRIYNKQMKVIEQNEKWFYLMTDFYPRLNASLATMQNNGLHFDRQYLEESKQKYESELEKYSKLLQDDIHVQEVVDDWQAMYERGLEEFQLPPKERDQEIAKWKNKYKKKLEEGFKPSSSNDKQYLLYYKLGIRPPVEKTYLTSGAQDKNVNEDTVTWEDFKTNEETIQWIMNNHPEYEELCGTLLMWIKANTINNSFVTKYLEMISRENSDGFVHPSFNSTGTACVTGDTLIVTDKGILPIETISDNREEGTFSDVELNVPTAKGVEKVGGFYYSGVKDGIKITLCDGTEITTTPNHPLMVNGSWGKAEDITVSDSVTLKYNTNMYGNKTKIDYNVDKKLGNKKYDDLKLPEYLTTSLSEWLGMLISDGSISDNGYNNLVQFSTGKKSVSDRFLELSKEVFNITFSVAERDNKVPNYHANSKKLVNFLVEGLGIHKYAVNKSIPNIILETTKENQIAFIKGLSLDSGVNGRGGKELVFSSTSKEMMRLLRAMLLNMGIYSTTRVNKEYRKGYNDTSLVIIKGYNRYKYLEKVGFVEDNKRENLINNINKTPKHKYRNIEFNEEEIYVKVKSVEPVYDLPFYDLNVENEHSFIGNGIINHNTSRLSSSNPNSQNLPSNPSDVERIDYKYPFKRAINSRFENGLIVQADYSSLESHVLGLVAQDDEITQGFIDGKDTHKETASIMFDIPYADVDKVQRQSAKAITFG